MFFGMAPVGGPMEAHERQEEVAVVVVFEALFRQRMDQGRKEASNNGPLPAVDSAEGDVGRWLEEEEQPLME